MQTLESEPNSFFLMGHLPPSHEAQTQTVLPPANLAQVAIASLELGEPGSVDLQDVEQ